MAEKTPEEIHADELAEQARREDEARAQREADMASVPQDEPVTATTRLRAFEDEHFGKDAVRIRDKIERGSGSPYQKAEPKVRAQHQALEKLIVAEQKLADAHAALMVADDEHGAALEAVDKADAE